MRALLLLASLGLAGCGLKQPLQPPPGESLPAAPAMERRPQSAEELLEAPPIARPDRVDELLRRSEPRGEDRFDMPPAQVPAGEDPLPSQERDEPE